jgi:HK97 gp10 family phage protein
MADEVTVNLNLSALLTLGDRVAEEIEKVLDRLNDELTKDARSRAPVKTGFLRENISGTVNGPLLVFTSAAPYSGFCEYGTRRQAAKPFFTPAVDQARAKLPELLQEAFRQALTRAR